MQKIWYWQEGARYGRFNYNQLVLKREPQSVCQVEVEGEKTQVVQLRDNYTFSSLHVLVCQFETIPNAFAMPFPPRCSEWIVKINT